jgi:hypothetical protein
MLPGVGLRERARKKLMQSSRDLDRVRLADRYNGLDLTHLDEMPLRLPVRVGGEVQGIKVVPRAGSTSLEVTIVDGTGRAVAVFLGRRRLPGLEFGRGMMLEGVGRKDGGRIVLLNPAYTLLSA